MNNQSPAWNGPPDYYTQQLANATFTALNSSSPPQGSFNANISQNIGASDSLGISNTSGPVDSNITIQGGSTTWITDENGLRQLPGNVYQQPPLANPLGYVPPLGGGLQWGTGTSWQQQLTEQDVKRIIEDVLKGNIKDKKEDDKTPDDVGMLMKQFGFPQLMIDIVMEALAQKWPVKKELKKRMEDLIVHEE